jgi:putative spermidine/putrescine transport system ATP-binding protein
MENTTPAVQLIDLAKRYGDFAAVDGVSLEVHPGEFLTFLGSSGSGKTTTLNMIAGFDDPTGGAILLNGTSVSGLPPQKRNIGMVFQRYTLFPHMTVEQNVGFPLSVRGVAKSEIATRVNNALKLVQLERFATRKPSQLSGGQQQRVALARALVYEPQLLLMDEPLGALDKKLREEIQLEIRKLHHRLGVTILYVTHDQEEALRMSDRIAVFEHGKIVQVGSGEDLYRRPATAFVAGFVGNSNFLQGRVTAHSGPEMIVLLDGDHPVTLPANGAIASGDKVRVMIRPEAIDLTPAPAPKPHLALPMTVVERIFLGDTNTYQVAASGQPPLEIRQAQGQGGVFTPEVGAQVFATVAPERCHVFPAA